MNDDKSDLTALYECIRDALDDAAVDGGMGGYEVTQHLNQLHGMLSVSLGAALEYARGWRDDRDDEAANPSGCAF